MTVEATRRSSSRQPRPILMVAGLALSSLLAIALAVGISVGIGDLPIPLSTTYAAIYNYSISRGEPGHDRDR